MTKTKVFLMLTLILLMSAVSVNAQVIIGGDGTQDPHAGAGLDLSLLGAEELGLLLPSVELTDAAGEFVLVSGATEEQKKGACGMVVYNIAAGVLDGAGLYVWDGKRWQAIALAPPPTVTDAEGNTYSIGYFGDAGWWMTENLRSTYYIDANEGIRKEIPLKKDYSDTDSPYYYYPNGTHGLAGAPSDYQEIYGLLYTWAAATGRTNISNNEGNTDHTDYQGVCPNGWHLPSDYEWSELEKEIATNPDNYSSQTTPYENADNYDFFDSMGYRPSQYSLDDTYWGRQMKSITAVSSSYDNINGTSKSKTENGFDALFVGSSYGLIGGSYDYGSTAYFWSSSSSDGSTAWYRCLYYTDPGVLRVYTNKYYTFSVRCKKN
jgi:uncharacterized protein (TIGR02145 family)